KTLPPRRRPVWPRKRRLGGLLPALRRCRRIVTAGSPRAGCSLRQGPSRSRRCAPCRRRTRGRTSRCRPKRCLRLRGERPKAKRGRETVIALVGGLPAAREYSILSDPIELGG